MTIELFSSPWVIYKVKKHTYRFFRGKKTYHKQNNVYSFFDIPLVLAFSNNDITIILEPTDFLVRFVLDYLKEVLDTRATVGARFSQKELIPLFAELNCILI